MLVSGIKSRPVYTGLRPDPFAKQNVILTEVADSDELEPREQEGHGATGEHHQVGHRDLFLHFCLLFRHREAAHLRRNGRRGWQTSRSGSPTRRSQPRAIAATG